jgi:tetratricopeptide (TPR) repeat protein
MNHRRIAFAPRWATLTLLPALGLVFGCAGLALMPAGSAQAASGQSTHWGYYDARYFEARLLMSQGRWAEATDILDECRRSIDCPAQIFLALADALISSDRIDDAAEALDDGLRRFPDSIDLHLSQARVFRQQGRVNEAIATLGEARALAPHRQAVLEMLSELHLSRLISNPENTQQEMAELIGVYNLMLETRRGSERLVPLLILSTLYLKAEQPDMAVQSAREALDIRPRNGRVLETYATALVAAERVPEAIAAYGDALLADPADDAARQRLDALLLGQGGEDARFHFYNKLAADHADNPGIQQLAGRVLMRAGRLAEAERCLLALLELRPDDLSGKLSLYNLWIEMKQIDRVVAESKKSVAQGGDLAPALALSVAEALESRGHSDAALDLLEDFNASQPMNENVALGLVAILIEKEQPERAESVLREINALSPENFTAIALLAEVLAWESRFDDAHQLLANLPESVSSRHPGELALLKAGLLLNEGASLQTDKRFDDALATYGKAIALLDGLPQPQDEANSDRIRGLRTNAIINKGLIAQRRNQFELAEQLYREALEYNPADAETWNTLGYFYAETNQKLDEALSLVNKALELSPDAPHIVDSLGWVYFRQGKFADAETQLRKAVGEMGPDAGASDVWDHLGDTLAAIGKTDEARDAWRKAVELGGLDDPQAVQMKIDAR